MRNWCEILRTCTKHCLTVILLCLAVQGHSGDTVDRPAGLLWNRTGLPAVFPLQVRSAPGQDYFMVLSDAASGAEALAAYIRGGDFFRVLVPPGTYALSFAAGYGWQGEEALFGDGGDTRFFELDTTLTFAVRDARTKAGHLVDIRDLALGETTRLDVRPKYVCQRVETRPGGLLRKRADFPAVTPLPGAFLWSERYASARAGQWFQWPTPENSAPSAFEIRVFPARRIRTHIC